MHRKSKLFVAILRIAVGWFFFYQGIEALLDPNWTIAPYIQNPLSFQHFYTYVADPSVLLSLSYIVKGALVVIGALLILGLFVRVASVLGLALMLFAYFPLLAFPYVRGAGGSYYYIVDGHVILALLFVYFYFARAGEYFGLGTMFRISRY